MIEREERFNWMGVWAAKNHLRLSVDGECGLGRPCVGVMAHGTYPDYEWFDEEFNRIDNNGEVWAPPDAYRKHPCVAVLGHGEEAERQLYQWLKWFEENGFVLETGNVELPLEKLRDPVTYLLGQHRYVRMVRKGGGAE